VKVMPVKAKATSKTPAKAAKSTAKAAKTGVTKAKIVQAAVKAVAKKAPVLPAVKKITKTPAKKPPVSAKPTTGKPASAMPARSAVAKKPAATPDPMPKKALVNSPSVEPKNETRSAPLVSIPSPSGVPQRSGRPSSRLASLTVPSMAQSVASTAAKSSYAPLPATPVIIPPLPSAAKKDQALANNWKTKSAEQLTDAELLAMPDSEYMNDKQLAVFRLKLVQLKTEILASAGATTEHLREDTVVVPDPADRATIEEEHALELRTRDRERKLLKKIEQSIGRIDAGDYGYCDETGEPIGVGRLLARPTATLSLEAQQRRELKQKMFGD